MCTKYTPSHYFTYLTFCVSYMSVANWIEFPVVCCTSCKSFINQLCLVTKLWKLKIQKAFKIYVHISPIFLWRVTYICDQVWENVHSSHIRFCSFRDPQKPQAMVLRFQTFRDDKVILVLQFLKVSHLSVLPKRCYELLNLKNWMCEQCTFSQIQSQLLVHNYNLIAINVPCLSIYSDAANQEKQF